MLVLTRKQKQQIQIGEDITLTIIRVKGSTVRLGIEAPEGVRILRSELSFEQPNDDSLQSNERDIEEKSEAEPGMRCDPRVLPPINPATRNILERMLSTC